MLSGDVTQRARRAQFDAARAFVDELCAACGIDAQRDVLIIPGNHDIPLFNLPLRVLDPYGPYVRAFGKRLEPPSSPTRRVADRRQRLPRPWRHKHGELSSAQNRARCRTPARNPDDALRVVVTHQPLMVIERDDRRNLVRGYKATVDTWVAAGADIFLSGHTHQSFVAPLLGSARQAWVVRPELRYRAGFRRKYLTTCI